jgi:hypothetical protein
LIIVYIGFKEKPKVIENHKNGDHYIITPSSGLAICNACGLYAKLHGIDRPVNLRSDVIRKRTRKSKTPGKVERQANAESFDDLENS